MDPLTVVAGLGALAGIGAGLHSRRRVLRAEAEACGLRRQLQAAHHAACHDPLTGLPNRRAFYQLGAALVADASRHPLAAALIDLDDFKDVNDRYGHAAGDAVLVAVAARLATCFGGNLVARLGGDEFAGLLCVPDTDQLTLDRAARALATITAEPVRVGTGLAAVTASVGLVPVPPATELAEAVHRADLAMYRAKMAYRVGSAHPDDRYRAVPVAARHAPPARTHHAGPAGG
ncbi:MAG TPA: GGDEF domain-containing protein [Rugosimonospora sp.]|nr:GGDEF domain-containing protein [Rugosimonospora sp.]